jgi:hypothetical protein
VTVVPAVDQKEDIWNKGIAIQHHCYLVVEMIFFRNILKKKNIHSWDLYLKRLSLLLQVL